MDKNILVIWSEIVDLYLENGGIVHNLWGTVFKMATKWFWKSGFESVMKNFQGYSQIIHFWKFIV